MAANEFSLGLAGSPRIQLESGDWTKEEAKQLFDHQVNEGNVLRDPDGFWRWKR